MKLGFPYFFLLGLLISAYLPTQAQYLEGGLMVGGTVYEGDLAPRAIGDKFKNIRPAGGIFFRQNFDMHWAARLAFTYGRWTAADGPERAYRNLSFYSNYSEVAALVEFSFPGYEPGTFRRFSPYVFLGVSYFRFNPKTEFQGREYELQPLGTEGQGLPGGDQLYSRDQVSIPFGGGLKFALTPSLTIAVEFGPRLTLTDYIDDVSGTYASYRELAANHGTLVANLADRAFELTGAEPEERNGSPRGNPDQNDWYFTGGITISYHFYDLLGGGRGRGCPVW